MGTHENTQALWDWQNQGQEISGYSYILGEMSLDNLVAESALRARVPWVYTSGSF